MKEYPQIRQIISVILLFTLMIEFTGCYTARAVQTSEITAFEKYVIHTKVTAYPVTGAVVSSGVMTCKPDIGKRSANAVKTHIYLTADSVLSYKSGLYTIPLSGISKIKQQVPDRAKTRALTTVVIIAALIGLGVAAVAAVAGIYNAAVTVPQQTNSTGMCTNW